MRAAPPNVYRFLFFNVFFIIGDTGIMIVTISEVKTYLHGTYVLGKPNKTNRTTDFKKNRKKKSLKPALPMLIIIFVRI